MDYAKKAGNILVESLKLTDRISIISYDDRVSVLWPSSPVESPDMVKAQINRLTPGGSTNLTGGMMKGVDEVLKESVRSNSNKNNNNFINRVILLSDGLANQGITNPMEIKRLVRESRKKGVQISTMGLGDNYNEDLMQDIAENGGGNYYFIENPNQMTRIFKQEMSILFKTVAKEIDMNIITNNKTVKEVDIFGFISNIISDNNKNDNDIQTVKIVQENFYSGENRTILVRLKIDYCRRPTIATRK